MHKVLVAYYSRDGHTRTIAREIAHACGADIEEITEPEAREGAWGYLRSAVESVLGITPPIQPPRHAAGAYDLVVIGTPIWFWNIASPVRSYVTAQRAQMRHVAFFLTCGGSGQQKVFHDLRTLCGRAPLAKLALVQDQCTAGGHTPQLAEFVHALSRPAAAGQRSAEHHPRHQGAA